MQSWTDKQWKWRGQRALMQIPDPLLGFCCCVFMILKHEMQVFTTCLFLPSLILPCGRHPVFTVTQEMLWDFSQHPSWSSRWHQPQIPFTLAWKTPGKTRRTIQPAQPTHRTTRKNKMAMRSNYFKVTYHAIIGKQNRLQTQFFHYTSCSDGIAFCSIFLKTTNMVPMLWARCQLAPENMEQPSRGGFKECLLLQAKYFDECWN